MSRDARRFQDVHLQNLLDKEYTDESALQDATREGLQTQPALPAALVDKLLKVFGQSGDLEGLPCQFTCVASLASCMGRKPAYRLHARQVVVNWC